MQKRQDARYAWLVGIALSSMLLICLLLFTDMRFSTNDDKNILRATMHFQDMGSVTFFPHVHTMYIYLLKLMADAFPTIAWLSVVELFMLWLSNAVVFKSIILCFRKGQKPLYVGVFFCIPFLLLFSMYYSARITYTVTAAFLGTAAVAHAMSIDCANASDHKIVQSATLSVILLGLSLGLRREGALPSIAFCVIVLGKHFLESFGWGKSKKRSYRPLIIVMALSLAMIVGVTVEREIEIDAIGMRDTIEWQKERIKVIDFVELDDIASDVYEEVGWSDTSAKLLKVWYTMDEQYSTEAFRTISANSVDAQLHTTPGAAIADLGRIYPLLFRSFVIVLIVGCACVVLLFFKRKTHIASLLTLLATGILCLAMFAYLASRGRIPDRAVLAPALPAAVIVFCLMGDCLPEPGNKKRWQTVLRSVFCVGLVSLVAWYAIPAMQTLRKVPPKWDYNTYEDLDQQCLLRPDLLFIYSTTLVNDLRMFPDVSGGLPHNLTFWGGWERGSQAFQSRLAAFGLDSEHFVASDWLRPFMRFITIEQEPEPLLLEYLHEKVDPSITYEQEKISAGLYTYRFYIPE